jgi:hypothetical protein
MAFLFFTLLELYYWGAFNFLLFVKFAPAAAFFHVEVRSGQIIR